MCEIGTVKTINEKDNQLENVKLPTTEGTPWVAPEVPALEPEVEPELVPVAKD